MMLQELGSEGETVGFDETAGAAGGDVSLAPVLDVRAAKPLHAQLMALRGEAVVLDASNVERIGAQCAAILLSAARSWASDEQEFRLVNPSEAFEKGWGLMGLDLSELGHTDGAFDAFAD